jgi:hypothetical protein
MTSLTPHDIGNLKDGLATGRPLSEVVTTVVDGRLVDNGFWRFFGFNELGPLSLAEWNGPTLWKHAWRGLADLTFWGEDVFGNQLLLDTNGNVILWDHENASTTATGFDLVTVLDTSLTYGLGWLDFYSDGSYLLAKDRQVELPIGSHWHWIQPLILGGQVAAKNMTAVERVPHLIGHAQLWLQVRGMPPGSHVVPKRSR